MTPIRCYKEGGDTIGWACSKCGTFFSSRMHTTDEQCQEFASDCCDVSRCHLCRGVTEKKHQACEACHKRLREEANQRNREAEQKRFDAAKKVRWQDYVGVFFHDDKYYHDNFFELVDDTLPECDLPEYVWGCDELEFRIDADETIERELESQEFYEDASSDVSDAARKKLQELLDVWCTELGLKCYLPDYDVCILTDGLKEQYLHHHKQSQFSLEPCSECEKPFEACAGCDLVPSPEGDENADQA